MYDGDELLGDVRYGDGATVRVTNLGRRNRANPDKHGFWLDLITGEWLSEKRATEDTSESPDSEDMTVEQSKKKQMVTPFVEDRRNIAVIRWAEELTDEAATSMQYAIERGIEAVFQLEDSELASERLNDADDRGRLLFVEAAEGGAGVLRRLQSEPEAMAKVAAKSLEILHVDPISGEESENACVRGCYRCLLSYGNQRSHESIDRRLVIDLLQRLARSQTAAAASTAQTPASAAPQGAAVSQRAQSILDYLAAQGLNLPDGIGQEIEGQVVDFAYSTSSQPTVVIVEDESRPPVNEMMLTYGNWNVLTVRADAAIDVFVKDHATVFGVVK